MHHQGRVTYRVRARLVCSRMILPRLSRSTASASHAALALPVPAIASPRSDRAKPSELFFCRTDGSPQCIQWTLHAQTRLLHHMRVDLSCFDTFMPEQLLHRPDVRAILQ